MAMAMWDLYEMATFFKERALTEILTVQFNNILSVIYIKDDHG